MNTNNKHPHFSRTVLHNGEERVKRIFRDQLAELAGLLEVGISLLVVVALMLAVVPLIKMLPGLLVDTNEVEISLFLQRALDIVIGIEFIKMLAKHSLPTLTRLKPNALIIIFRSARAARISFGSWCVSK